MFYKGVPSIQQAAAAVSAQSALPFISTWKTNNPGLSTSTQVKLPLAATGTYNFLVNWGDGTQDTITVWNAAETTHTYAVAGTYIVTITGIFTGFRFAGGGDRRKLLNISQFGILRLGANNGRYFEGCNNLTITAVDPLDLIGITNLFKAFAFCSSLTTAPGLAITDTSNIQSFQNTFELCILFNENIGNWDVSSGSIFSNMFIDCNIFNQNLNSWDVSSGSTFSSMFSYCYLFNSPLSNWDVSNATTVYAMFLDCNSFDQYLGSWNLGNCTEISFMFYRAYLFKGAGLGNWDIRKVLSAQFMFGDVTLPTTNYDSILIGWSALILKTNVPFSAGLSKYSAGAAATARTLIVSTYNWTITDGGLAP
jgi:surface protein